MSDESSESGGAELPRQAIEESMLPVVDEHRAGPLSATGLAPLRKDAEQYWQGLFARLELEADQMRDLRRDDYPGG